MKQASATWRGEACDTTVVVLILETPNAAEAAGEFTFATESCESPATPAGVATLPGTAASLKVRVTAVTVTVRIWEALNRSSLTTIAGRTKASRQS